MLIINIFYIVIIIVFEGCSVLDQVFIDVVDFSVLVVILDIIICQNFGVMFVNLVNFNILEIIYFWILDMGLDDVFFFILLVFFDIEMIYQLISIVDNGVCVDIVVVMVMVLLVDVDIFGFDIFLICQDEEINLIVEISIGNGNNLVWSSVDVSINVVNMIMINVILLQGIIIFVIFMIGECIVLDLVYVVVDLFLFNIVIVVDFMEDFYCQGELVILSLDIYEFVVFLEIEYVWVFIGVEIFDILYNLVFFMIDIFIYQ